MSAMRIMEFIGTLAICGGVSFLFGILIGILTRKLGIRNTYEDGRK